MHRNNFVESYRKQTRHYFRAKTTFLRHLCSPLMFILNLLLWTLDVFCEAFVIDLTINKCYYFIYLSFQAKVSVEKGAPFVGGFMNR